MEIEIFPTGQVTNMEIIPAIMPANFRDLEKKVEQVVGSVKTIQLDLMDGKYVTAKTWPLNDMYGDNWLGLTREEFGMPHWEAVDYELDLMVNDIPNIFAELVTMGPKRIIFHFPTGAAKIEELKNFIKNLDTFYKYEIELGIAYEHGTNTADILDIKDDIKFVQCMGIDHVGVQGADFDKTVFDRINWVKENLPDYEISVDGGVDIDTIKSLADAGVTRFVSGSAIYSQEYPSSAVVELEDQIFE